MAKKKTTETLLAELDSLDLEESEQLLRDHDGLREAAYQRDMERAANLRTLTHGPN